MLRLAPPGDTPHLASAFLYFFRREVETNEELSRGLTFDALRGLTAAQDRGFSLLDDRTSGILDQFDALEAGFAGVNAKLDTGFA